ncbi:MAG: glycosyltransferase family 39 protein [Candidatus Shapirobacteria bacterium]|nr:glycosyltransferase family 39 protein [Candidatus Shapirobacteria bacterium]MDD5073628.1 glycosyltransferase family 39 protein [Candidatus Shapirobacteria bacterium]MDD5481411.1 glycosyltransferase family 39 protein [Candidatus Shapirobacteria bacterium]
MKIKKKPGRYSPLFLIIIFGAVAIRLFGINWDQGYYLHPDERMIFFVAHRLDWPKDLAEFFQKQSPLNPKFFAYGSWPIYLLRGAFSLAGLFNPNLATYSKSYLVGRILSVTFELGIIIFLMKLGAQMANKKAALWSGFFYTLTILPVQLAHFYTVDTPLTFFIIGAIFFSCRFIDQPKKKFLIWSGVFFGMALASKIAALPFGLVALGASLLAYQPIGKIAWRKIIISLFAFGGTAVLVFVFLSPYALIDADTFIKQVKEQQVMTKDPFVFPYTLQYVNTPPYWYQLKNYFLWGAGPFLAGAACFSWLLLADRMLRKRKTQANQNKKIALLLGISLIYFLIVGRFSVKFMRYLLPLYPLMALLTGLFFSKQKPWTRWLVSLPSMIWLLAFLSIYAKPHSRIEASSWINQSIPAGSTIAIEHWDDHLPLFGQENYQFQVLELYQPESFAKWEKIDQQLERADYLIIASHRLYQPLSRLTDCARLPANRCYSETAQHYQKLFSDQLPFQKVAEFYPQPEIKIGSKTILINDFGADESFIVYDHPPITIFKKSLL